MKTFKTILALSVLFSAFIVNAIILEEGRTLVDGSSIPAGAEMIITEDGAVQYVMDGVLLAQVKTTETSTGEVRHEIIRKKAVGTGYEKLVITDSGSIITPPMTIGTSQIPAIATPSEGGAPVFGSGTVVGPTGVSIPDSPTTVI